MVRTGGCFYNYKQYGPSICGTFFQSCESIVVFRAPIIKCNSTRFCRFWEPGEDYQQRCYPCTFQFHKPKHSQTFFIMVKKNLALLLTALAVLVLAVYDVFVRIGEKEFEEAQVEPKQTKSTDVEDYWWQPYVNVVSRRYKASNDTEWCQDMTGIFSWSDSWNAYVESAKSESQSSLARHQRIERQQPKTGMYFVKVTKAGSSTAAAVALQISDSVAAEKGFSEPCDHHIHHGLAYTRRKKPFFLWTQIRRPHSRTISHYFFRDISRGGDSYNSTNLIKKLDAEKNIQIKYIGVKLNSHDTRGEDIPKELKRVNDIIRSYNFISVAERMDESLVVMKLLFGFRDETMIVMNSKHSGGLDDGEFNNTCYKIKPRYTTDDVDEYIAPGSDYQKSNLDNFLYAVADKSLDKTIDFLGRDRVEKEVLRHQQLRQLAEDACSSITTWPCDTEGAPPNPDALQDCYFGDVGCGHECIMDVVRNAGI